MIARSPFVTDLLNPLRPAVFAVTGVLLLSGCGEKPTPPPQAAAPVPPTVTMEEKKAGEAKPATPEPATPKSGDMAKPAGKAEKADHDHDHDHNVELPKTIEEAIAGIKEIGVKVEKAIAGGKTEVADDMVHSVGHLIEDLQEKIAAAKLGDKARAAAEAAADEIYTAYDAIDEALHAAEDEVKKFDFGKFSPKIKKATETLEGMFVKAKQALTGEVAPAAKAAPDGKSVMKKPEADVAKPEAKKAAKPKPEAKSDAKPEMKKPAASEPKPEAKKAAKPQPEAKSEAKPEMKKPEASEPKPEPKEAAKPKPENKPEAKKSEPDAKEAAKPEAKTPEAASVSKPEAEKADSDKAAE